MAQCPVCGASCERKLSKKGNHYWKCITNKYHVFYDDNGLIGKNMNDRDPVPCPICGSLCFRQLSQNNRYYWRCGSNYQHAFYDNNGIVGRLMTSSNRMSLPAIILVVAGFAFLAWMIL